MKSHTPPKLLPAEMKAKWTARYESALKQAKVNTPDDEKAQHAAALRAANSLLTVTPPESAEEIEKMPAWQILKKGKLVVDGEEHTTAVTIDGKKYIHPTNVPKAGKKKKNQTGATDDGTEDETVDQQ